MRLNNGLITWLKEIFFCTIKMEFKEERGLKLKEKKVVFGIGFI